MHNLHVKGMTHPCKLLPGSQGMLRQGEWVDWMVAGGRYDGLLKALWPATAGLPMGAVGATLNVDRLITMAESQAKHRRLPLLQASQVLQPLCDPACRLRTRTASFLGASSRWISMATFCPCLAKQPRTLGACKARGHLLCKSPHMVSTVSSEADACRRKCWSAPREGAAC
jgi:hypothetical protein